jgi:iron complex transport system substrate-binding protein
MFNGDWTEQSPLGKAEWIKFFGALYGLDSKNSVFAKLKKIQRYFGLAKSDKTNSSSGLCSKISGTYHKEKVGALFLKDAQADYMARHKGTGSASLPLRLF